MECLAARFDRGLLGVFNHFGKKMQYCRTYCSSARGLTGRNAKTWQNVSEKSTFRCRLCSNLFLLRRDSRTCSSRSLATSSSLLVINKNAKNKEHVVKAAKSTAEGASNRVIEEEDFFGFEEDQKVVDVSPADKEYVAEAVKKYDFLFKREAKKDEEKLYVTTFGNLRYDVDNMPKRAQDRSFEKELGDKMESNAMADDQPTDFMSSPLNDQYLQLAEAVVRHRSTTRHENSEEQPPELQPNYLEDQLLGNVSTSSPLNGQCIQPADTVRHRSPTLDENSKDQLSEVQPNYLEDQFFVSESTEALLRNHSLANDENSKVQPASIKPNYLEDQFFGTPSMASDNVPEALGLPFESSRKDMMTGPVTRSSNFIEEQYFLADETEVKRAELGKTDDSSDDQKSLIEEQYFGREASDSTKLYTSFGSKMAGPHQTNLAPSFAGEQRFYPDPVPSSEATQPDVGREPTHAKIRERKSKKGMDMDFINSLISDSGKMATTGNHVGADAVNEISSRDDRRVSEVRRADRILGRHKREDEGNAVAMEDAVIHTGLRKPKTSEKVKADIENPKTAFDFAMKVRQERNTGKSPSFPGMPEDVPIEGHGLPNQKTDSFGFRIYSDQVADLEKEPEFVVLKILTDSALYNENDILALCKPYGLPVHQGAGHRHHLTKFLPDLAKHFCQGYDQQELYTVHRLDKETTGVLLLAKTQEMAKRLSDMLAKGKIKKTYWALTKGTPSPLEGIIDIPIGEATIAGKLRMVLKPPYSADLKAVINKSSTKAQKAVTHYKVLASKDNAALVELAPTTGVKHQIRVHLASAMACPILGDHKYSHLTKLAPQKLPSDVLQRLGVRQSKVRTLSMHLHARAIAIPEIVHGRNIIIGARLPKHFVQNMKRLKINIDK